MFKKIRALSWLRGQIILFNKGVLLQVLMPLFIIFLYKYIFSLGNAAERVGTEKLNLMILNICLPFVLAMAVGSPIIMILAEEREKHNLQSLRLVGVTPSEYILSAIVWPIVIGLLYIVITPVLIGVSLSNQLFSYSIVLLLTTAVLTLFFLTVALLSKTQVMGQSLSVPALLLVGFLPMFASLDKHLALLAQYSFMGLFTDYLKNWDHFQMIGTEFFVILLWIAVLVFFNIFLVRRTIFTR